MREWAKNLLVIIRSPLCRHVALAVFVSIIVIEAIILIPSYFKQEGRLLAELETRARVAGSVAYSSVQTLGEETAAATFAQRLLAHEEIKGVAVFSGNGRTLTRSGEGHASPSGAAAQRHEVSWQAGDLFPNLSVALSLDSGFIATDLRAYVLRIAGLVVLISAFVTISTMAVLGHKLIFPMLKLRERLVVGEDRSKGLEVPKSNRTDEFGDFIRKVNDMLAELYDSRQGLQQRVADQSAEVIQSEQRLRAFIDHSPAAIYLKDTDSRVIVINKAYEQRYGVSQEQAVGSQGHEWLGHENAEILRGETRKSSKVENR